MLVCFVDWMTVQLNYCRKRGVVSPLYQIINTIMFRCNTKQQLSFTSVIHTPMSQITVLYAPLQFKKPHKLSVSIMLLFTHEHATDSTPPRIPRQLLSNINITREEEKASKIKEDATHSWKEHNIPGSKQKKCKMRQIRHSFHSCF
jgi:hypothetical protein